MVQVTVQLLFEDHDAISHVDVDVEGNPMDQQCLIKKLSSWVPESS